MYLQLKCVKRLSCTVIINCVPWSPHLQKASSQIRFEAFQSKIFPTSHNFYNSKLLSSLSL